MKAPAFQFYADDFIGGTLTMTHEERGLYILALCLQWGQGGLAVDDLERLGSAMAQPSLSKVRAKFTECVDGLLRNDRLERERQKQTLFREERSKAGKKGAFSKWTYGSANGSAIAQPMANDGSPSPSPSPNKEEPAQALEAFPENAKHMANARLLLETLNEITGKAFREVPAHLDLIVQRLKEPGITPDGIVEMMEFKAREWKGTDFEKFLRPQTLFQKSKFAGYYDTRQQVNGNECAFDTRNRLMQ